MTIASEITRLQGAKSDIRQAIIDKGVSVSADLTIDYYACCIAGIQGGPKNGCIDILIVGGGGAGSGGYGSYTGGSGGGAGGVIECFGCHIWEYNCIHSICVGAGGVGNNCQYTANSGGNSFFDHTIAYGGGGGGYASHPGGNGGSGGGGGYSCNGGSCCSGQGHKGGNGKCDNGTTNTCTGGGGGGYCGAGGNGNNYANSSGGLGKSSGCWLNSNGNMCYYGQGGEGNYNRNYNAKRGAFGWGGGGSSDGACCRVACEHGNDGVVIVRYKADGSWGICSSSTGGTKYQYNGYQYHCFSAGSGTFTPVFK